MESREQQSNSFSVYLIRSSKSSIETNNKHAHNLNSRVARACCVMHRAALNDNRHVNDPPTTNTCHILHTTPETRNQRMGNRDSNAEFKIGVTIKTKPCVPYTPIPVPILLERTLCIVNVKPCGPLAHKRKYGWLHHLETVPKQQIFCKPLGGRRARCF